MHGTNDRVDILGVKVDVSSIEEVARRVVEIADLGYTGNCRYVCATSVHGLIEAHYDPAFRGILNQAEIIAADGVPLVWFSKLSGYPQAERVYGPDLTLAVCERSAVRKQRHFFYGGAQGVPNALGIELARKFPGLVVAGAHSPPFRELSPDEIANAAREINNARPDILWIGLSTPKQERLIARIAPFLHVPVALTVGAAFDFHTGRLRQSPRVLQALGLEWAFRLAVEPRRLWRRYARNNPRFMLLAAQQLMRRRREPLR
ncbi:MAG TPA: WecB/TagA/CpsF family glycosyltransferase [Terriglobales bacterium]